jgi:outer membrane biosynthesis protein TonB
LFGSDREVRIIVEVDATGKVIGAAPEPGQEARLQFLANQALGAARQSRFKPAQLNGKNVPSKVVVRYAVKAGR